MVKNIWNDNVYTVVSVMDGGYWLDDRYLPFNDEICWELADKPVEPKFKVGDKVKRKVVDPNNPVTKYIYTVFEIENDKYCLDHNDHESWIPISAQDEFELVNEPKRERRFNIGDIVQRKDGCCFQYRITGYDGDDYVAIDTFKLKRGLKSQFDITKIGLNDDNWELVEKAESYVQQIEPIFKLGVDLSVGNDVDSIWRNTLTDLVGGVTQRNTDAFVWLIDETLRYMDCDAYEESAVNGMRIFAKELKKRLGV
jgi:hypothetical protein